MNAQLAPKVAMPKPRLQSAFASAPASVGNVGVGFDILGHTVAGAADRAEVRRIDTPTVRIASIHGCVENLPMDAAQNTAGMALLALRKALGLQHGFEIVLHKGIALGSGMGGSAASCVAALVAANALLERPLSREALYNFALEGEAVASGGRHGDNVGPMLLGGLALATRDRLVRVPVPAHWHCALVHPHVVLETRKARAALAGDYALGEFVVQSANLALVLAGCWNGDAALVRDGLKDVLVEPRRASLIPNFARAQAGSAGSPREWAPVFRAVVRACSAGSNNAPTRKPAAQAMHAAFAEGGLDSDILVAPIDGPAASLIASLDADAHA